MDIRVGQKVAYPNHGVCCVETIERKDVGANCEEFYNLRVLSNNSSILVPKDKVAAIGIRPVITTGQCRTLLSFLAEDFPEPDHDWKLRSREYSEKILTGDVFAVADVLKKLRRLTQTKTLSFREQRMFEKANFLIVSEIAAVCAKEFEETAKKVERALEKACEKHFSNAIAVISEPIH